MLPNNSRFGPRVSQTAYRLAQHAVAAVAIFVMAAGIVSCSSDGGDGGPTGGGNNPIAVSGYVFKGAVSGSTVHVRSITAAGDVGGIIAGPFTSDATGRWSGEVPAGTVGMHAVTAVGGTYTDESSGQTVTVTSQMLGLIAVGTTNAGNVTPMTHAVFVNGQYRVQLGASIGAAFWRRDRRHDGGARF